MLEVLKYFAALRVAARRHVDSKPTCSTIKRDMQLRRGDSLVCNAVIKALNF